MINIVDKDLNRVEITEDEMRIIQNALYTERYNFMQHKGSYSDEQIEQIEAVLNKLIKVEF